MAVESSNVARLMGWFAEGGPGLSHAGADALVDGLGALVFQGESDWPEHTDQVDAYRDRLRAWFADDDETESTFIALTGPDGDPEALVDWFLPVLRQGESRAVLDKSGKEEDSAVVVGLANPNSDGTPGTAFYRLDEATGEYLYGASAQGGDWATYEQRRYSTPERDDNYGLDYRLDRTLKVYEWYDAASGTWRDQTWADRYAAARHGSASETQTPAATAPPQWDENWAMFYRVGPGGVYEFADAHVRGDESSGCGEVWLSHEQVLARSAPNSADDSGGDEAEQLRAAILAAVDATFEEDPELKADLSDEDIEAAIAAVTEQVIRANQGKAEQ